MSNMSNEVQDNFEIQIKELFNILWKNKDFIILVTGIFSIVSIIYSLSLNNIYTSKSLLIPTNSSPSNNITNQYSNLASLAGLNSSNNQPDVVVALAFIKSQRLVAELMKYDSFLPDLIAAKHWKKNTNTLIYEESLYDLENKQWIRKAATPSKKIPSIHESYKVFSNLVKISQDDKTQLATLSVEHISPYVAKQWADLIIKEVNLMIANMRIKEAQNSINYLNEQIKITPYAELRTMFYELIQEKTQNMMLAKANTEYALTTIDPPLVSELKSKPNRVFICILGFLLGAFFSLAVVLIRSHAFKREDKINLLFWRG